jgi:hypothetical protein
MEIIPGILIMVSIILFLLFAEKIFKKKPKSREELFKKGYDAAMSCINKNIDNNKLYNQCQTDDAWDRGWKQACSNDRKLKNK